MPASSKEKIATAARNRFKTKDIRIADDVIVSVREISPAAMKLLKEKLWEKDADGKFLVVRKDGTPVEKGEDGWYKKLAGVSVIREWLLATMLPVDAVDEIMSEEVPDSVREEIFAEARSINGEEPPSSIAKNS